MFRRWIQRIKKYINRKPVVNNPENNPSDNNTEAKTPYDYGAVGDGITDDSQAFIDLFDNNTDIYIPDGTFLLTCHNKDKSWLDDGGNLMAKGYFNVKSNTTINCSDNSVIKVKPNDYKAYVVIMINDVENVTINNMTIVGDRAYHIGSEGEWGYGIFIADSNNVTLNDCKTSDLWGDGINLFSLKEYSGNKNIYINRCTCTNNRRQGMSIESGVNVVVTDSKFLYTNGTLPTAGVDIEPAWHTMSVSNVIFRQCTFSNNRVGLLVDGQFGSVDNITVESSCIFNDNSEGNIYCYKANGITVNVHVNGVYFVECN